ncbi:hypothetical protein KQI30_12175 [Clostridium bornimense]|uniref:hypothetical protein n=1 Tax=Clostridium bornimense TaxID=1216932 RepID=UPI001C0F8970|nr:hypothetical protein [Clostridium bornimense]MBU5317015.1 hypothetical protein [Clostridium bornimense]
MKKIIICILSLLIIAIMGFQYYRVNKEIPKEYYEEKYSKDRWIKTEHEEINVEGCTVDIEKETGIVKVEVALKIKGNDSNKVLRSNLCDESILSIGMVKNDYAEITNLRERDGYKEIKIQYHFNGMDLDYVKSSDEIRLYLAKSMYEDEVVSNFKNKKLYAKYISLGVWGSENK